jgi:hypothetical protein
VKSYCAEMGIIPPAEKFKVPDEILGFTMESYTGGRSEARIRHVELPVAPVDFTSEYPTVCVLMELMKVLIAKDVSFEDATVDVQKLLEKITLEKCFDRSLWPDLRFFALVKPKGDVLPVRTMYNGFTQNVGNNYLTDEKPIWVAGPDLINSAIQNDGKVPRIVRALRRGDSDLTTSSWCRYSLPAATRRTSTPTNSPWSRHLRRTSGNGWIRCVSTSTI